MSLHRLLQRGPNIWTDECHQFSLLPLSLFLLVLLFSCFVFLFFLKDGGHHFIAHLRLGAHLPGLLYVPTYVRNAV